MMVPGGGLQVVVVVVGGWTGAALQLKPTNEDPLLG